MSEQNNLDFEAKEMVVSSQDDKSAVEVVSADLRPKKLIRPR